MEDTSAPGNFLTINSKLSPGEISNPTYDGREFNIDQSTIDNIENLLKITKDVEAYNADLEKCVDLIQILIKETAFAFSPNNSDQEKKYYQNFLKILNKYDLNQQDVSGKILDEIIKELNK